MKAWHLATLLVTSSLALPAVAQDGGTTRVNVASGGIQVENAQTLPKGISSDGRFVVMTSNSEDLVLGDKNGQPDVFVHDRLTNSTELASVSTSGVQGNGSSVAFGADISGNGRYVVFSSLASNLVENDTNERWDVFLRDRLLNTLERVSVTTGGGEINSDSMNPKASSDGRYITFLCRGTNVGWGSLGTQVAIHDRQLNTTEIVSISATGVIWNGSPSGPNISANGRYVVFTTLAPLVAADNNSRLDVYLRDTMLGETHLVSVSSAGVLANHDSQGASVSDDGRFIAFASRASNLVAGDTNNAYDIFLRDRTLAETLRVSVSTGGIEGDQESFGSDISDDGQRVTFQTSATNLFPGDVNADFDVLLRDVTTNTTSLISRSTLGVHGDSGSYIPFISGDGQSISFGSRATNLVPQDTNGNDDVFVRDSSASLMTPNSLQVFRGVVTSGNLGSLLASDDNRLSVRPGVVFTSQEAPVQLIIEMTSQESNPSRLELFVESRTTSPAIGETIDIWDHSLGSYVTAWAQNTTLTDTLRSVSLYAPLADYVGPNGLVRVRLRYRATAPVFTYPWQTSVDHVVGAVWK